MHTSHALSENMLLYLSLSQEMDRKGLEVLYLYALKKDIQYIYKHAY